jgi:hypothetical protein
MANTLTQIGIETGNTVEAYHVSQSIDAFTGAEAYDITLSGSFNMTGPINGEPGLINPLTASYAITSSYVLSSSYAVSASYVLSSSYAVSASYVLSSSYAVSASHVVSSSYALSASFAPNFANTNLTQNGNRTHSTAGNTLVITDGTNDRLDILSTETVFNDSGANIDFRVESDNDTNALFVDASANQVRIGVTGSKSAPSLYFGSDSNTGFYNSGSNGTIYITSNGDNAARINSLQFILGDESFRVNQNYAGVGLHVNGWLYANGTEPISSNVFFNGSNLCRATPDKGGYYLLYQQTGSGISPEDGDKFLFKTIPSGSATGSAVSPSTAFRIDVNYVNGGTVEPNFEIANRLTLGQLWSGTNTGIGRDSTTGQITAVSSDQRLKTNIQTLTSSLNKVKSLRGTQFEWTNENDPEFRIGNDSTGTQIGLIAQEVEQVLPEVVKLNGVKDYKTVEYDKIVAVLIEAIKEQQQQIDSLQQQIDNLPK